MGDQLSELVRPVVEALGCELWGIEQPAPGKRSTLKIYIDAEQGINVEDCARVSRQVSSLLDVENSVKGEYTLEVSSPGLDRRLFRLEQCADFVGEQVRVRLKRPYEGSRKYTGQLRGVEGDEIVLLQQDEEFFFPFEDIERANVVPGYQIGRVRSEVER